MKQLMAAVLALGSALALSPEEVWRALEAHAKVAGYLVQARQGPVVYQVAFRRPWVRIDWLEGPEYLKGSALVTDGQRAWSKGPKGPWQEGRAMPPEDPLQLLFTGFPEVQRDYVVRDPEEEGGLWRFLLARKTPPKDERQPAAWRITLNPKGHLPFRYEVLSPSGKVLSQVEYVKLDLKVPPQSLFEVKP
ncbi:LolA family protein [Thermus amyloliquefaciens]|uniref:LolA family protein n=1 Tax=Thermus amyloliquefaciens TaxID=1449080 RepID=UPI00056E0391|nr:hypothetical protein [Thermus amyloliquefaciens]